MPYLAGFGGQITVNNSDGLSLTVNITGASGSLVVYADATRTTPVNFPDIISGAKTYYTANDGSVVVSVKFNGVEIAGASSTTVPVTLVSGASYSFQPSIDSAEQAALIQQGTQGSPGSFEPTGLSDSTLSSLDGRYQTKGAAAYEPTGLAPTTKATLDAAYQPKGSYEPSGLSAGTTAALAAAYQAKGSYEPTGLAPATKTTLDAAYQPKGSYEPAGLGSATVTALDAKYVPKSGTGSFEPSGLAPATQTALDGKYILKSGLSASVPTVPSTGRSGRRTIFGYDKAGVLQQFEHQDLSNPGYINVLEYGCDNTGTFGVTNATKAAANDAGFAAAIAAAQAVGKGIYIPRGVYNTTTTVLAHGVSDVKGESSRNNVYGTVIYQDTTGTGCTAVMTIGGNNAVIEGIYAMHHGLPDPNTSNLSDEKSSGFWIIRAGPVTTIRNLFAYNCGWGFYCGNLPSGDNGVNFMYSCTVETLRASRCNRGGGRFSSFNAGNTGSNFNNLYFANDGACTPANIGTSVQTAWYFGGGTNGGFDELIINQINAEWFSGQNVIVLDGVTVTRVHGIHVEGWVPTGNSALIRQTPNSLTRGVEYGEVTLKRWLLDTGYTSDFALWDGSRPVTLIGGTVNMNGPDATTSGLPAGTPVTTGVVPAIRRHRWSTGANGSQAIYSGAIRGSSVPTLTADSTQSTGMGIQVVDRFASATTLP